MGKWKSLSHVCLSTTPGTIQSTEFSRPECWSVCVCARARARLVAQSCPTLCDPMDWSPPSFSVHGILWARTLEWVAMHSSRASSQPRWVLYQLSHQGSPALLEQDVSPIANLRIKSSSRKTGSQALITRQPVVFPSNLSLNLWVKLHQDWF